MTSLRSFSPSLTRITAAGAVGAALHIGKGDPDCPAEPWTGQLIT